MFQLAAHLRTAKPKLFAAAVLLEQYHGDSPNVHYRSGVADLMRAVLDEAIHCFRKLEEGNDIRTRRLAHEAEAWLFNDDENWPFAFVNVCGALGLDPTEVRRTLRCMDRHPVKAIQRTKRIVSRGRLPLHLAA